MKRTVVFLVVVSMLFSFMFGFLRSYSANANSEKTPGEILQMAKDNLDQYLKEMLNNSSKGTVNERLDQLKIPAELIDGVSIPKDVIEAKSIKSGDDFVPVSVDAEGSSLIAYANKNGYQLNSAPVKTELTNLKSNHQNLLSNFHTLGVSVRNTKNAYVAYNGISFETKVKDVKTLYQSLGENRVHIDTLYTIDDQYSNFLIGATSVWSDPGVDGTGMVVGVIDTGVDYTHPDLGGGTSFPTTKIPAGYDFGDNDSDPMDCNGHGTHVSGIIAADGCGVMGVAPKARIVFGKIVEGCAGSAWSSVIMAAFDYMADPDNIDSGPEGGHPPVVSVNMSFGSPYGFATPDDPEQQAIEACISSGIVVSLSAGNNYWAYSESFGYYPFYPDGAAVGSPSVTPDSISVAASWNTISRYVALREISSNNLYAYTVGGDSDNPVLYLGDNAGVGYQYVYCGLGGSSSDFPASVSGKIALIERGTYNFSQKIYNAEAAGAIGAVVFNSSSGGDTLLTMNTGGETLPAVFIGRTGGLFLKTKAVASPSNPTGDGTGRIGFSSSYYVDVDNGSLADKMVDFSSWGPPPDLSFKPDITAPGGGIWSTVPVAKGSYDDYSGTSMAAPHIAACAALLKEAHPDWTTSQIKTALMNTADLLIDPALGLPYSPHKMGAGRVNIYNALHNSVTVTNFHPEGEVPLPSGTPYVALGELPDYKTVPVEFTLKLENSGDMDITYDTSETVQTVYMNLAAIPVNATMTINPSTVTVPAHGLAFVDVSIDATNVPDWGSYGSDWPYLEGFISFTPVGFRQASSDEAELSSLTGGILTINGSPGVELHIPYMGFLGKWNDFNESDWQFNPIIDMPADDTAYSVFGYLFGSFGGTWPWYAGDGPMGQDFYGNMDRSAVALNPYNYTLESDVALLRNARNLDISITDDHGNLVRKIDSIDYLPKDPLSWYGWYWYYTDPETNQPWYWYGDDMEGNVVPDGKYHLVLTATPQTIFNEANPNEPQVIDFPVSVDTVVPHTAVTSRVVNPNTSVTFTWSATDPAPSSGLWGFEVMTLPYYGVYWYPPNTTSDTFDPGTTDVIVYAIDNAFNIGSGSPPTISLSPTKVTVEPGEIASCSIHTTNMVFGSLKNQNSLLSVSSQLPFAPFNVSVTPYPSGYYGFEDNYTKFSFYPNDYDAERTFVFTISATNMGGSAAARFTVNVTAAVDNTPPELTVPDDTVINQSTFTFLVVATDDSGSIVKMVVKVNGMVVIDKNNLDPTIPLSEGSNTVEVIVYDASGNTASKSFTVISDTKPPLINLELPETVTSPSLEFEGNIYDSTTGVKYIKINGIDYPVTQSGKVSGTLTLDGGVNTIKVEAADKAGNTATATYAITYVPISTTSMMITLQINNPYITVNGISKKIDSQGSTPMIKENRTILPIRTIIESLGGTVEWDAAERKVTTILNGHSIVLWIDNNMALVDGNKTMIDPDNPKVIPVIINGRTYLPLRFISEKLGASVDWNAGTQTVTIYYWP